MYSRSDPRLRRTLNQLTQNLESANEQAQEGLYTFQQQYINPCFSHIASCVKSCAEPCLGREEVRRRRQRGRTRGRLEHSFDFYDDWDEDENDLLGWGNDELEHLLAGSTNQQPGLERSMSYGTSKPNRPRRKSAVQPHDGGPDPTILPHSSYFGFLDRLPWKVGSKGVRYKPSAADLQERPGAFRRDGGEHQPLIEDSDEDGEHPRHKRNRSDTTISGHTTDSLSSRGDLFPSEDEDDAVPLDDEFAINLERRTTGHDETSSGKTRSDKSAHRSRLSTRTASSKSAREMVRKAIGQDLNASQSNDISIMSDLRAEEAQLAREEDETLEKKRSASQRLALQHGLSPSSNEGKPTTSRALSPPPVAELSSKSSLVTGTVPFPSLDPTRSSGQIPPAEERKNLVAEPAKRHSAIAQETDQNQSLDSDKFVPAALPRFSLDPD
jgi:hypothetical protein